MESFWIDNVHRLIKKYSNLNEQKEVWMGLNPRKVSSYGEMITMLFDDNDFESFIVRWEEDGKDANTLTEMKLFRDILNRYDNKISTERFCDSKILIDPEWLDVVAQAGKVMEAWRQQQ